MGSSAAQEFEGIAVAGFSDDHDADVRVSGAQPLGGGQRRLGVHPGGADADDEHIRAVLADGVESFGMAVDPSDHLDALNTVEQAGQALAGQEVVARDHGTEHGGGFGHGGAPGSTARQSSRPAAISGCICAGPRLASTFSQAVGSAGALTARWGMPHRSEGVPHFAGLRSDICSQFMPAEDVGRRSASRRQTSRTVGHAAARAEQPCACSCRVHPRTPSRHRGCRSWHGSHQFPLLTGPTLIRLLPIIRLPGRN